MVSAPAVHRLVEHQAASRGESCAYADKARALTYRELNCRANAVARALVNSGFRRGAVAAVRMVQPADLLVSLLAVMKAGGAYMWIDAADTSWPVGVSALDPPKLGHDRCIALDLTRVLTADVQPSPNLPILTRGSDIACVMRNGLGRPDLLVPHSTITALMPQQGQGDVAWSAETGTLDVWLALMTGATVTPVNAPRETVAA